MSLSPASSIHGEERPQSGFYTRWWQKENNCGKSISEALDEAFTRNWISFCRWRMKCQILLSSESLRSSLVEQQTFTIVLCFIASRRSRKSLTMANWTKLNLFLVGGRAGQKQPTKVRAKQPKASKKVKFISEYREFHLEGLELFFSCNLKCPFRDEDEDWMEIMEDFQEFCWNFSLISLFFFSLRWVSFKHSLEIKRKQSLN